MHNGPSTQTRPTASCCGGRAQVLALTREETPGAQVELVRCSDCDGNVWRLDGVEVAKERALAALSEAFTSTAPRAPRPVRVRPASVVPAAVRVPDVVSAELVPPRPEAGLLAGWQVFGTTR